MVGTESASTIEKAIRVLLALAEENREIGTSELGRRLDVHKATVSRILLKLKQYDFVYKNKETGKYWLGPAIHQLAMTMADVNFNKVTELARSHIDELSLLTHESVALEVWLGNSTVPTYMASSDNAEKPVLPPGEPLHLHAAAGAKAILSFTHTDRVDMLLSGEIIALTKNTITDIHLLKASLVEFNKQGYSIDNEELHEGVCAIAAPIFNTLRQPIAAIVILIPAERFDALHNPSIIAQLKKKTTLIAAELAATAR